MSTTPARISTSFTNKAGISTEAKSHPHIHPFLASIVEQPTIILRSAKPAEEIKKPSPEELLPYTPLSALTVDGMDPEQVWAQLELRAEGLCRIIKEVAQPEADDEDGSVMGWEEEEEEEDSTEDMTVEEWEKMMAEGGYEEGMSDEEGSDEEEDSEMESEDDEDVEMGSGSEGELELGSDEEGLLDEDEDEEGEGEEDDDEDEATDDDADDGYAPGPSKPRTAQHPTLDDTFFSIDDFNRQTEEMEAGRVTSGALGGDEDEEAELEDLGAMFLEEGGDDDEPLMYSDFFEAPPRPSAPTPTSAKGKGRDDGKKKSKRKVAFAEDEDDEEPEANVDPSRGIMDRVKADLFDDSEDEGDSEQGKSILIQSAAREY